MAFLGGLAAIWPLSTRAEGITSITVLDAEFRPIRTITSGADLALFNELWAMRVRERAEIAMRPDYKIGIVTDRRSERWLYDPAGFVRVLTVKKAPIYRMPSPAAFNKLLGITAQ